RLTRIGGAQVERTDSRIDLDCVQILPAKRLDTNDVAVAERCRLLNERYTVNAELDLAASDRATERLLGVVAHDSGAASTDVRLDEHRVAKSSCCLGGERRMIDRPGAWVRKSELLQQIELRGFRELI